MEGISLLMSDSSPNFLNKAQKEKDKFKQLKIVIKNREDVFR